MWEVCVEYLCYESNLRLEQVGGWLPFYTSHTCNWGCPQAYRASRQSSRAARILPGFAQTVAAVAKGPLIVESQRTRLSLITVRIIIVPPNTANIQPVLNPAT